MRKIAKNKKIITAALLTLVICTVLFLILRPSDSSANAHVLEPVKGTADLFAQLADQADGNQYEHYIAKYEGKPYPQVTQIIPAENFSVTDGMEVQKLDSFEGAAGPVVYTGESGAIHWDVEVEQEGLYHIGIRYFPVEGNSASIERELLVDGSLPFEEMSRLVFSRVWGNERTEIETDIRGNDLRPRQVEKPVWQDVVLRDIEGYYKEPFSIYLSKGNHRITLNSLREPMVIDHLKLFQVEQILDYESVAQSYKENNYPVTSGQFVKVQGEDAILKSNPSLYPISDRSSPATEPYNVSKIRLNTIGGVNWKVPGQWITWEVDIPEDGLYEFGLRYKQSTNRGINVIRKLYIDNKVPFQEVEAMPFKYDGAWQMGTPGVDGTPYLFYLTKGKHEIKMELTMGDMADIIRVVRSSIQKLNALYLKIIMLTSAVPDPFRDYQLENKIPEMRDLFFEQSEILTSAADEMDKMVGGASSSTTILRTTAYQLNDLGTRSETLTSRLKQFKDNVSALGTWLLTVNEQPLEIDYLFFKSSDVPLPPANSGFAKRAVHEVMSFARSFQEDYSSVSSTGEGNQVITVWIAAGRDQAQLLRSMIDNSFTPQTNIDVNLQLVNPDVVLPATLAGKGPDIALTNSDVVNFAMRNALEDLTQFSEFSTVKERFNDSAFVSFTYQDGIYAIPETENFPMLFYRKDILDDLGLRVPETWDDMYWVIPELQKQNMQLALPTNIVFETMLYQNGGEFYEGDGIATALGSEIGIESFRKWTELYTNYKLPIEFDFINRFRTGEMPIGIADYSTYNFLTVFAPEIRGQWDFAALPGVEDNGIIRRDTLSTVSGTVMFKNVKHKDAAWKFIQWWTDTEAQTMFGREMEAILGESARYATANLGALQQLPWSARELNQLQDQFQWIVGRPQVPGGYSLDRHINNAFYEVMNDAREPRETLENYVRTINQEITIKREEFDLTTK